jgi:hypothetical protein
VGRGTRGRTDQLLRVMYMLKDWEIFGRRRLTTTGKYSVHTIRVKRERSDRKGKGELARLR